jgi:hypothetical protein
VYPAGLRLGIGRPGVRISLRTFTVTIYEVDTNVSFV